jgi:Xaa-Pro aminopeptidase
MRARADYDALLGDVRAWLAEHTGAVLVPADASFAIHSQASDGSAPAAAARSACARTHAFFQARLGFGPSATADAAQVSDERKLAVASPIALLKACKNAAEIAGMRDAHVRAGAVSSFAQTSRRRCGSAGRMRGSSRRPRPLCSAAAWTVPHAAAATAVH